MTTYTARPDDATRGLVIAPDIWGLRPLFERMCERMTGWGYACTAVEPFGETLGDDIEQRQDAVARLSDATQVQALVDAADALDVEPVAVMGFCMGGYYALKAAATGRFDRAVSFYGMVRTPDRWRSPGHTEPLDSPFKASVLGIYGTNDVWAPMDEVEALRAAGAEVAVYEGAEHGFVHDPDRPVHRPDDAADAWRRVRSFLDQTA